MRTACEKTELPTRKYLTTPSYKTTFLQVTAGPESVYYILGQLPGLEATSGASPELPFGLPTPPPSEKKNMGIVRN